MKKLLFGIATLLMITAQAQYDPEAKEILDAMSESYKKVNAFTATFTQKIENKSAGIEEELEGKITVKNEMYKLEIIDSEIYNDGKSVWVYTPEMQEVTVSNYNPEEEEITPGNVYDIYKKGFKYALIQTLGNGDQVIELDPESRDKSFHKIRLIISSKNELKTFSVFEKTGSKYVYSIRDFKTSSSIGSSHFTFDTKKYPNVEVIDFR